MALSTADIQAWLSTNEEIYKLVCDRNGDSEGTDDPEWDEYCKKVLKDAKTPKKWVRQSKYAVGSPTDKATALSVESLMDVEGVPDLTGGIVRTFWLRDTDHVTILTVEKDNKIIFFEDMSD